MASADEALAKFRKRHGDAVAQFGADKPAPPRISTGVLEFDVASAGGWPKGHMSVIWGAADSGKSTLLYKTMATYLEQHPDEKIAFFDLEGMYSSDYGVAMGMDEGRVLFCDPDFAEHACDMIVALIRAEDIGLIAVDSLAAFCTEAEDEKSFEDAVVGKGGLLVSRLCRVTRNRLNDARRKGHAPTMLYVNQERSKIGRIPGKSMPGGHAPHFFSSMKVKMWGGKEKVDADVDPNKPLWKHVEGEIEKKKGPIVCKRFEYDQCVVAHRGLRPGATKDWPTAASYLGDMGQFGKTGKSGWQIMGNQFRLQKECLAWYEEHRLEARDAIIEYLVRNPDAI